MSLRDPNGVVAISCRNYRLYPNLFVCTVCRLRGRHAQWSCPTNMERTLAVGRDDSARRCRNYRLRTNLPTMSLRDPNGVVAAQPFARNERYGCGVPPAGAISCTHSQKLPHPCRAGTCPRRGSYEIPCSIVNSYGAASRTARRVVVPYVPPTKLLSKVLGKL